MEFRSLDPLKMAMDTSAGAEDDLEVAFAGDDELVAGVASDFFFFFFLLFFTGFSSSSSPCSADANQSTHTTTQSLSK